MVELYPFHTRMLPQRKALGYREVVLKEDCLLGPKGLKARGHEFHYSYLIDLQETDRFSFVLTMKKGAGIIKGMDGLCYKNVLATYTHLHALGATEWVSGLINAAGAYKEKNLFVN